MRFHHLKVKNFKSFVGEHEFDFCGGLKGLHFVTGENLVSKKLEGNGVGKSSLWDAVCWCLYGRTLRGLKAGNVASWQVGKNCEVELTIALKNQSVKIYRSWSPNKLTINGSVVEQQAVDSYIKLSFESFQHAVVLGQFSTMFFDLQPSAKLALFSQVLSLDYWLQKSEEAKAMVRDIDREIGDIESQIAVAERSVQHLKESMQAHKRARDEFEERRKQKVALLKDQLESHENRLSEIDGLEQEAEHKLQEAMKAYHRFEKEGEQIDKLYQQKMQAHDTLRDAVSAARVRYQEAKIRLVNFQDLSEAATCPTCYGLLTDEHISAVTKDLIKDRDDKVKIHEEDVQRAEQSLKELQSFDKNRNDFYGRKRDAKDVLDSFRLRIRSYQNDRQFMLGTIDQCKRTILSENKTENPFKDLLKGAKDKLAACVEDLKQKRDELAAAREDREAVEYWVKGFKDVRLFLIEEALLTLEVEVNNNLLQLGLKGWTIKFDVERETKSGTISKGFQVMINSPANSEPVPWESWSGGETQRLRVAGTLGLSNLICAKLGVQSDVLVLDEPTTHLNPKGVEALMSLLENKARLENKQIWVVDHRALDYGGFASITKVTKDKTGSYIDTEIRDGE